MAVILATKPLGSLCHTSIIKLAQLHFSVVLFTCVFGHCELMLLSPLRTADSAPPNGGHWEEGEEIAEKEEKVVKRRRMTKGRKR